MRDADVRKAVKSVLNIRYSEDCNTRIVEEMGIWSGSARIDIAVINGELHGYELKSARDTLKRLPAQAELYNQVFDRVTLVAADRHIQRYQGKLPQWWGVILASPCAASGVELHHVRDPSLNPLIDPLQVARLLWKSEALALLEHHGIDRGVRSGTVEKMAQRLAEELPLADLAFGVRLALKRRLGWLGQPVGDKGNVSVHSECRPSSAAAGFSYASRYIDDEVVGPAAGESAELGVGRKRIGMC